MQEDTTRGAPTSYIRPILAPAWIMEDSRSRTPRDVDRSCREALMDAEQKPSATACVATSGMDEQVSGPSYATRIMV